MLIVAGAIEDWTYYLINFTPSSTSPNVFTETNIKRPEECRCALQVFQYIIKEFRDKTDTPELEIKDLAMEIRGYGIFANVAKEDVKFIFVGLIQRCEQIAMPTMTLAQAVDVFDERFYGLPDLIDVISAIIIEMINIGEEFLGPLECLTYMTIDYYPRYQPKPQATTCLSIIKMISVLQTKPISINHFYLEFEEDKDETTTTDPGFGMKPV
ncbi:unnamed protein product [Rotaria sp. Silwood2]|nr:unnamed protein product [Rotaria sp. Silwood2]